MDKILVIGGAGYIGSHMVKLLCSNNYHVVTLDNLSAGYRDAVLGGEFIQGDLSDKPLLDEVLQQHQFDAVIHFASHIQVGESVTDPKKYYSNNFVNTLSLMDTMRERGVNNLIFSSTAAIFGEPLYSPIDEKHPKSPINPYGRTKYFIEEVLADYEKAYGFNSVCLRYFNAAGADPATEIGERHEPETHLIPLVLQSVSGRRPSIKVFGSDYDTPDGTCIRDYVHVNDLCSAHLLALHKLLKHGGRYAYNLGNGSGFSVQEVIAACENVTGRPIIVEHVPRRDGDPARLVADSTLAREELGWKPAFADLETIIKHAWLWESKLSQ